MKGRVTILLFVLLAIAQLAVPAGMILQRERVLRYGEVFRFQLRPIDPADPFRGRYVALSFNAARITPKISGAHLEDGQQVYAALSAGPDGFAAVSSLSASPPASGAYVPAKVLWFHRSEILLRFPFDRFYMEESAAPRAERAQWAGRNGENAEGTFAVVRVLSGHAVIEDLYIKNKPVYQYLQEQTGN